MNSTTSPGDEQGSRSSDESVGEVSRRNRSIRSVYAKIFRIVLGKWIPMCQSREEERNREIEELVLPSNEDWRQRVYYRLVELQREYDAELAIKRADEMESVKEADSKGAGKDKHWEWSPGYTLEYPPKVKGIQSQESNGSSITIRSIAGSMTEACVQPGWRVNDILLAAQVLQKVSPAPVYSDEAEMRRVYGLVYDVLRYKNILNRALDDVGFWKYNSAIKDRERIVWLLLYDMQGRKFSRRGEVPVVEERERIFKAVGLMDIEDALLAAKTRLAASMSRLRIGGSALNLDELLPSHLRVIEGVTWANGSSIASGWVNTLKVDSKDQFHAEMSKLGFVFREDNAAQSLLDETNYVFDPLCPKMINLCDKARERLAVSDLVRDHSFVFLERSLCMGAAALAQAIRSGRLCGPVVLTHSIAPRHTGYLAGLLADIEDAGRLLAFGAGDRRCEYETYLKNIGVTLQRCRIFSEKYSSPPPSAELERATVVLAVPPCSCTGVRDIVDLAVARGGDANLLESLTNACNTAAEGEIEQPRDQLADQLSTLKYALTRPNVQFLIYEAHTVLPSETTEMIRQVVEYANRTAMEKYIREHPPKKKPSSKDGKSAKPEKPGKDEESLKEEGISITISADDITIPDSDLFEIGSIDDIYGEGITRMLDPGCFLAVIRRKEMMQFDSLFMIKVAESKGLFGDPNQQKPKPEPDGLPARRPSQIPMPKKLKRAKFEIDRLMAPTHSSFLRSTRENRVCPRHKSHVARREKMLMMQIPKSFQICQDSRGALVHGNLLKSRRSQRVTAMQSRTASFERTAVRNKEPLCPTQFLPGRRANDELSRTMVNTVTRKACDHGKALFTLADILKITSPKGPEWNRCVSSSTALRPPALARAIRRIPFGKDREEREETNFSERLRTNDRYRSTPARSTRIHHPGGSVAYNRLSSRHAPGSFAERLHRLPRAVWDSVNSTFEVDLDETEKS